MGSPMLVAISPIEGVARAQPILADGAVVTVDAGVATVTAQRNWRGPLLDRGTIRRLDRPRQQARWWRSSTACLGYLETAKLF
jgi:hypothetical protein